MPLVGMGIEGALHHLHLGPGGQDLQGAVGAAAVDHHNSAGPGHPCQGAADVGLLVEGEDQRGDLLKRIWH
jgi:hypothetical protein